MLLSSMGKNPILKISFPFLHDKMYAKLNQTIKDRILKWKNFTRRETRDE